MHTAKRAVAFVSLVMASPYAWPVAGVGDITYDPTVHSELVAMYENAVEAYDTTIKTLDKISSVEQTITRAYNSYDAVKNFNLNEVSDRFKTISQMGDGNIGDRARRLRNNLTNARYGTASSADYLKTQAGHIADLTTLIKLDDAAKANVNKSASSNPGQAQVITSQNTSVMAVLAADEAAARKQKEIDRENAADQQLEILKGSGSLLSVFSKPGADTQPSSQ